MFVGKGRSCRAGASPAQAERSSASPQKAVLAEHSAVPGMTAEMLAL